MSGFKIFKELLEIAFGVGIIALALSWGFMDVWIGCLGGGLILWGIYDISKELRDSGEDSDVAAMAAERERIIQGDQSNAA